MQIRRVLGNIPLSQVSAEVRQDGTYIFNYFFIEIKHSTTFICHSSIHTWVPSLIQSHPPTSHPLTQSFSRTLAIKSSTEPQFHSLTKPSTQPFTESHQTSRPVRSRCAKSPFKAAKHARSVASNKSPSQSASQAQTFSSYGPDPLRCQSLNEGSQEGQSLLACISLKFRS